jgi:hypothetical protein
VGSLWLGAVCSASPGPDGEGVGVVGADPAPLTPDLLALVAFLTGESARLPEVCFLTARAA